MKRSLRICPTVSARLFDALPEPPRQKSKEILFSSLGVILFAG